MFCTEQAQIVKPGITVVKESVEIIQRAMAAAAGDQQQILLASEQLQHLLQRLKHLREKAADYKQNGIPWQYKFKTDQWSLGCVLLELLTGCQYAAFYKLRLDKNLMDERQCLTEVLKVCEIGCKARHTMYQICRRTRSLPCRPCIQSA